MKTEERNIILNLINGNEKTYVFLFEKYYLSLCAYSKKYVGRNDIAEEIVSDTFLKIWKNRKSLKINSSLKAYLFKAVCNNSLLYIRQEKQVDYLEDYFNETLNEKADSEYLVEKQTEGEFDREEIYQQINKAVAELPEQQQKAFILKRMEGKKNKEVAEIMGLSIKTVEMHLSKAMVTLRGRFKTCLLLLLLYLS